MSIVIRLVYALAPLLLSALLGLLLTGPLSAGGGEKDVLLAIPLLAWSVFYFLGFLLFWARGAAVGATVRKAAGVATGAILVLLLGLAAWEMLQARAA